MFFLFFVVLWLVFEFFYTRQKLSSHGKAVFITGCDTGFGRLAVKRFRILGYKVFANFLKKESADSLKRELEQTTTVDKSLEIHPLVFDVTDEKAVIAAQEEVQKALPEGVRLWAVINNAGISRGFWHEFTPLEDYKKVMDVNFFGMVSITKHFLPLLKQSRGRVINVSSLAGCIQTPCMSAYGASKFASESFSDALRVEMVPFGINVSIIEPGFMKTDIVITGPKQAQELVQSNPKLSEEYAAKWGKNFAKSPDLDKIVGDPRIVVDAWVHAVSAKRPRHRYMLGRNRVFPFLLIWIYRLIPSRIWDFLSVQAVRRK